MRAVREYGWRERRSLSLDPESMTEQSHKDQTDINHIVTRFQKTGQLPEQREGYYGDVTPFQGEFLERVEHARKVIASYGEAVERHKAEQAKAQAEPPPPEQAAVPSP